MLVQDVGGNCYRAIIQGFGGVENRCSPRECPLVLARRDRPARVEPQAMAARGRDVSTSSIHRYVLSYAIRHPAAVLLARARARRRKYLRFCCWLALLLYDCWKPDMPASCERIECACARRRRTSRPLGGEPNGCLIVSVSRGSSWAPTGGVPLLLPSLLSLSLVNVCTHRPGPPETARSPCAGAGPRRSRRCRPTRCELKRAASRD